MGLCTSVKSRLFHIPEKEVIIPNALPLTPGEIASFQALVKPAIVLLLLLRLGRPAGARELADILGLDEHTVAKYLRALGKLNLVVRTRHRGGYRLIPDRTDLFGGDLTVNKLQLEPVNTAGHIFNNQTTEGILTAVVDQNYPEQPGPGQASRESLEALRSLGIGEPKRSALACLAHVTPEYIRAWHAHLGYVKGEVYRPGLLIHVLETGDSAPEVSENGHPLDCECSACAPLICPQCNIRPCDCE
jgi:hypothetical protein